VLAAIEEGTDLLQRSKSLGLDRHGYHPPMMPNPGSPSRSFHFGIALPVQAHVSLEKALAGKHVRKSDNMGMQGSLSLIKIVSHATDWQCPGLPRRV
jgi:hypothetical protein